MIDHQIDDEMILRDEVSDEALEAAAFVALGALPTIMYRTDPLRDRALERSDRAKLIEGRVVHVEE